jgi:hypothetical protein
MYFTKHAKFRLDERFNLTEQDILKKLDCEQYIPLGKDKQRQHLLIYSLQDNKAIVLVHNTNTNEIITALPENYHNKWKISEQILFEIKELTLAEKKFSVNSVCPARFLNGYPHGYVIKIKYFGRDNKIKECQLAAWNFQTDDGRCPTLETFASSKEILNKIENVYNNNGNRQIEEIVIERANLPPWKFKYNPIFKQLIYDEVKNEKGDWTNE